MKLTDADIEEFMNLCEEEDGVRPSRELASEAATRLALLYERLLLPTPREVASTDLKNQNAEVGYREGKSSPSINTLLP